MDLGTPNTEQDIKERVYTRLANISCSRKYSSQRDLPVLVMLSTAHIQMIKQNLTLQTNMRPREVRKSLRLKREFLFLAGQ